MIAGGESLTMEVTAGLAAGTGSITAHDSAGNTATGGVTVTANPRQISGVPALTSLAIGQSSGFTVTETGLTQAVTITLSGGGGVVSLTEGNVNFNSATGVETIPCTMTGANYGSATITATDDEGNYDSGTVIVPNIPGLVFTAVR